MIKKSLLLAAALAGVALTGNALAYSPKDSAGTDATPVPRVIPSSVVNPTGLPRSFAGLLVNIEFTLDQDGKPQDIKVLRVDDTVLKRQLVAAFRLWRFEPGVVDANASQKRFILPLEIRPES